MFTFLKNNKILAILMLNIFIVMVGVGLITPILPELIIEFDANGQAMGLLVTAYGITQFLLSPLTGSLSDRYGRKTFILAVLVIFSAAKLLFAVGDALWMLYASRMLEGVAAALIVPPMMAYVADITTTDERAKGNSMLVLVMTFGLANYESVLGLYVTTRFQFTAQHIAIILTTGAIIGVGMQALLVAKIIQAFGETKVIKGSLLLTSTAYIVLLFATHFWSIFLVTSIIFFATSKLRPALNTQLSKMAGNEQGYVAGMNNAYMSVGNIVGPTLAGFLFDANIFAPFIAGCCILFIVFLMIVRWN